MPGPVQHHPGSLGLLTAFEQMFSDRNVVIEPVICLTQFILIFIRNTIYIYYLYNNWSFILCINIS